MHQPIRVTGGSLGRRVVDRLLAGDHQVRVLSRRPRPAGTPTAVGWVTGELVGGRGLAAAVTDVAVIVHCASNPLRIVGVDRVPYRYYQAKLQAERLLQASGLPWTILRATQFHQLVLLVARGLARLPLVPAPAATSFQPIDGRRGGREGAPGRPAQRGRRGTHLGNWPLEGRTA